MEGESNLYNLDKIRLEAYDFIKCFMCEKMRESNFYNLDKKNSNVGHLSDCDGLFDLV